MRVMFSDAVKEALVSAGWFLGRKVDVSHWIEPLVNEGFTMNAEAIKLLEEFGGLTVVPKKTPTDVYIADRIEFAPLSAACGDFNRVNYWQNRLNIDLSPIAELGPGMLLIAGDGRVFSCGDIALYLDGISFADAMENSLICATRMPTKIE